MTPRVVIARAARTRIALARGFLETASKGSPIVAIGPSRAALTEVAAAMTLARGATFGIHRKTLGAMATEAAAVALARDDLAPARRLVREALVRTVVREAMEAGELHHFDVVARTPGFAVALARTLDELDLEGVEPEALGALPRSGADLVVLATRVRAAFGAQHLASRATILRAASDHYDESPLAGLPVVMLDVTLSHRVERDFSRAILSRAPASLVLLSPDDARSIHLVAELGFEIEVAPEEDELPALCTFRRRLFNHDGSDAEPIPDGSVMLCSAPAESLEAVEIARALRDESRGGVAFDEMAVVVRNRETYAAHFATAFGRAEIPVEFEAGTRRPHPAGRALLALLWCRAQRGSGRRLFEYLSTGQMPGGIQSELDDESATSDEDLGRFSDETEPEEISGSATLPERRPPPRPPLRKWIRMLGEIGLHRAGADQSIRHYVERRVEVARLELEASRDAVVWEEADADVLSRIEQELEALDELRDGLRVVLDRLDAVPMMGTWGEFLVVIRRLAKASLGFPVLVLCALSELAPLVTSTAKVELDEVIGVLQTRLRWLEAPGVAMADRNRGRVLITTPDGIRGRARRVIVVPGLAEGIFPARTSEDPLLLDEARASLGAGLATASERTSRERLALAIAAGAATERLYFTYPRIDAQSGRPRVPSMYALEVARAASGTVPSLDAMERRAAPRSKVALVWPAPQSPAVSIDDLEYTLSIVRELRARRDVEKGRARFLILQHSLLARALRARWRRYDEGKYTANDGLLAQSQHTGRRLADYRLAARAYAPSTLEAFAACPYRFYLRGIVKLSPKTESEPVDRFDPRLYGELYHRCQADLTTRLLLLDLDPQDPLNKERLTVEAANVVQDIAEKEKRALEPIVPRVFDDEMDRILADLAGWIDDEITRADGFRPFRAELSFGLPRHAHLAPESIPEDIRVAGGYRLKGAIDSIEKDDKGRLRVTDYKTGRMPDDRQRRVGVVGGGEMLQPLLYALAVEALKGRAVPEDAIVAGARLYFATRRGGFESIDVAIAPDNVARALRVLAGIDRAIERGTLLAAPRKDACGRCNYQVVCGPNEETRTKDKEGATSRERDALETLRDIRGLL